jgi:hypothetical protein
MGTDIDQETFDQVDYLRFRQRLQQCLATLARLLARPDFGVGPATRGAELELCLVDGAARPLLQNRAVRAATGDPRVTVELDRFNLELNATPTLLAGQPFTALGQELRLLLGQVADGARQHGGRVALVGILPTLRHAGVMTDMARYRALDRGLRRLRQDPFHLRIAGADPLELDSDDVSLEGANTSFQVHLRVDPAAFARTYNAVQLATAPVLAVAGNSPTFLGHRLWEETRIALCKQSIDDRDGRGPRRRLARMAFGTGWLREGPLELFAEAVRLHQPLLPVLGDQDPLDAGDPGQAPRLAELRLHRAACGAGTGRSTTRPWVGICGSSCGPCPPARPSSTCSPTPPSWSGCRSGWPARTFGSAGAELSPWLGSPIHLTLAAIRQGGRGRSALILRDQAKEASRPIPGRGRGGLSAACRFRPLLDASEHRPLQQGFPPRRPGTTLQAPGRTSSTSWPPGVLTRP